MLSILDFVGLAIGVVLVVLSFIFYKRKGESEISGDVLRTPLFIIGAVVTTISLIGRLLMVVM